MTISNFVENIIIKIHLHICDQNYLDLQFKYPIYIPRLVAIEVLHEYYYISQVQELESLVLNRPPFTCTLRFI